ncbi:hypothetical protein [Zhenhengia sp.]|jgi:hypothetical protein|uniref:hypothetical protein n=1 Tax=Zhenhengia sp. TaxID=2944208 RepID=UPI00307A47C5
MANDKYLKAISKFPKETIIKAVCFMRLDYKWLWSTCIDVEDEKIKKKIKELENKSKKLECEIKAACSNIEVLRLQIERSKVLDQINVLYDKIFKMYDDYQNAIK